MSFLDKINAKLGNGSLKVNLVLKKKEYMRGEEMKGTIKLNGGKVDQKVLAVFVDLVTEKNGYLNVYGDYKVYGEFVMNANETKEIEFTIELPKDGPFTKEDEEIQLITKVSIDFGMDSKDQDYIKIKE